MPRPSPASVAVAAAAALLVLGLGWAARAGSDPPSGAGPHAPRPPAGRADEVRTDGVQDDGVRAGDAGDDARADRDRAAAPSASEVGPTAPRALPLRVGTVVYRVLAVEPLLLPAPPRADDGEDAPLLACADAAWHAAPGPHGRAADALLHALRAADPPPRAPPDVGPPRRGRGLRWALVATWEAAALVARPTADGDGATVARARRRAAVPLPPPDTTRPGPPWSPGLLTPPPPHDDPPPRGDPSRSGTGRRDPTPGPAPPSPSADLPGVLLAHARAEASLERGDADGARAALRAAAAGARDATVAAFLWERAAVAAWRCGARADVVDACARAGPAGAVLARWAAAGALDARGDVGAASGATVGALAGAAAAAADATEAWAVAGAALAAGAFDVAARAARRAGALPPDAPVRGAVADARARTRASVERRVPVPPPRDAGARLGGPGGRR